MAERPGRVQFRWTTSQRQHWARKLAALHTTQKLGAAVTRQPLGAQLGTHLQSRERTLGRDGPEGTPHPPVHCLTFVMCPSKPGSTTCPVHLPRSPAPAET